MGQPRGQRMRLEMVDGDEWFLRYERQGLGRGDADQQAADQAWTRGDRDRVDIGELQLRSGKGPGDDLIERLDMVARRNLGHHPAIGRVQRDLRQHLV